MAQAQQPQHGQQPQQQQQPPPPASQATQSFSPPISSPSPLNNVPSPSPTAGIAAPPAKRPRLSPAPQQSQQPPTPQQSFGSPSFGTLQLPKAGSPVNGSPITTSIANTSTLAPAPLSQPPQPQPHATMAPPPGTMGPPPPRQMEKTTDAAQLTDVLASSGINVSEEEAYLTQGYGQGTGAAAPGTAAPSQPPRLQTSFSNPSFTSQPSGGTLSAGNSFTDQQTPIQQHTPLQPATPQQQQQQQQQPQQAQQPYTVPPPTLPPPQRQKTEEEAEEDARHRRDTAASRRAQYHLQKPFLNTAFVESQLSQRAHDIEVTLPMGEVFRPVPDEPDRTLEVVGPDGSSVIRTGQTIMNQDAMLGDMISLISLACEERLRTIVEHSAALSQNRRNNSNGVVPEEWADLADTTTATNTAGDKQVDGADAASPADGAPRKRSVSAAADEPSESNPTNAVKLPNNLALQSHRVGDKDVTFEDKREAKRVKRNSDAIVAGGEARAGSASTPGTATPTSERIAPEPEKKMSKKEQKKAESKVPEAVQHQQAVATARMATGIAGSSRFGGKKRQYSWLTGSTPSAAPRPGMPSSAGKSGGASTPGATPTKSGAGPGSPQVPRARLGEWRDDGKRGAGIHIKDILFTLEVDGTGTKPVQKGYAKQSREELDRPAN